MHHTLIIKQKRKKKLKKKQKIFGKLIYKKQGSVSITSTDLILLE